MTLRTLRFARAAILATLLVAAGPLAAQAPGSLDPSYGGEPTAPGSSSQPGLDQQPRRGCRDAPRRCALARRQRAAVETSTPSSAGHPGGGWRGLHHAARRPLAVRHRPPASTSRSRRRQCGDRRRAGGPPGDTESRALFVRVTNCTGAGRDLRRRRQPRRLRPHRAVLGARRWQSQPNSRVVWAGHVDSSGVRRPRPQHHRRAAAGERHARTPRSTSDGYRLVVLNNGGDLADEAADLALQADGKIVVVGTPAIGPRTARRRLRGRPPRPDGSFDTSFSGDGKA